MTTWQVARGIIKLEQGDITEMKVDAIVNAANEYLKHGGGVAGAIVRKGGSVIQKESDEWVQKYGTVPTGSAAVTGAGNLHAKYVIHAVGPVWRGGNSGEPELLRSAVINSLQKANSLKLRNIAFPAISTGIFGYPLKEAARVLLRTAHDFLQEHPESTVKEIFFVLYDKNSFDTFLEVLNELKHEN